MSTRITELQKALIHLEAARTLVQNSDRGCPIRAAIRHVEGLLEEFLDEAPHTPTAQTVKYPTVPPAK